MEWCWPGSHHRRWQWFLLLFLLLPPPLLLVIILWQTGLLKSESTISPVPPVLILWPWRCSHWEVGSVSLHLDLGRLVTMVEVILFDWEPSLLDHKNATCACLAFSGHCLSGPRRHAVKEAQPSPQGEATCVPTNSPADRWHQRPIVGVKMPKGDPSLQATVHLSLLAGAQSLRKRDRPAQLPDLQNYEYKEMAVWCFYILGFVY